jgi:hypothetical protein
LQHTPQVKDVKKAKFQLGVAEPKLGSAIQETTSVRVGEGEGGARSRLPQRQLAGMQTEPQTEPRVHSKGAMQVC